MRTFPRTTLALAIFAAAAAHAQEPTPTIPVMTPSVTTVGRSEVRVSPDRARVMVAIETRGETAAAAAADNARRTTAVIAALTGTGLKKDQVTTADYNVYPEQQWDPQGGKPPRIVGYIARSTLRVEIRTIDMTGRVIDAAINAGATTIQGVEFSASSVQDARRRAYAEAIRIARDDARAMALAAGASLGEAIEISSSDMGPSPRPMMEMRQTMAKVAETPINPGEITFDVLVTTRWRLRTP